MRNFSIDCLDDVGRPTAERPWHGPRPTDFLTLDDLISIVEGIVGPAGIRDVGLLEPASARPQGTVFGERAYPTLLDQAAALMHSIARFRPLVDGNKRLAWSSARAFLMLNGSDLHYTVDEAEEFVLCVARGDLDVPDVAEWFAEHVQDLNQ